MDSGNSLEVYCESNHPFKRTLEGGTHSSGDLGMNSDPAKKARVDLESTGLSKVLHFRRLPDDVMDKEIRSLTLFLGRVEKILVLHSKNQALVEMATLEDARKVMSYYSSLNPIIRGQEVYVQYSHHKELKNASGGPGGISQSSGSVRGAGAMAENGDNSVLRVIIDNMIYPITLDILHELFTRYGGHILKIVTFNKNGQFHALIQYPSAHQASNARMSLDGQNVYKGCCTLRIDYSTVTDLVVRYNDEKMRDYTQPDLGPDFGEDIGGKRGMAILAPPPLGDSLKVSMPRDTLHQIARINELRAMADLLQKQLDGVSPSAPIAGPSRQVTTVGEGLGGCVVLASNLNDKMISNYAIFVLFGCFGDVMRVKILYNKKDTALIQFSEPFQAQTAMTNLNGIVVYGNQLHLSLSKYSTVQLPKDGSSEGGLTQDYSGSQLHRFKRPGSKNVHHIHTPTEVLHISNIPSDVDEATLKEMFDKSGTVKKFKFFESNRKMALIEMSSMEESIHALIDLHNHSIGEDFHLRVSFTKSTI